MLQRLAHLSPSHGLLHERLSPSRHHIECREWENCEISSLFPPQPLSPRPHPIPKYTYFDSASSRPIGLPKQLGKLGHAGTSLMWPDQFPN
ncbi:unnamed protein product [Protopolystoma xenopodis]|uniref:Uncharacterized protein n=1 Tax=Protopolystoma xenopodis TaxID=117903 RepID=A0A3S5FF81_9PLAT|nr:unnamed protein product [Protopolystoma xenopodis]